MYKSKYKNTENIKIMLWVIYTVYSQVCTELIFFCILLFCTAFENVKNHWLYVSSILNFCNYFNHNFQQSTRFATWGRGRAGTGRASCMPGSATGIQTALIFLTRKTARVCFTLSLLTCFEISFINFVTKFEKFYKILVYGL